MKDFKVAGFPLPLYVLILALTAACMFTGCVPKSLVPAFLVLMVFGEGLNAIGNNVPVVKTYLGGSVICILGSAVLTAGGLIPEQTIETLDYFVNDSGFLIFYIAALICGILIVSILIGKSPAILLTGLGASAAVLMLIFRDSILGFVSGIQLAANDVLKVGDWISIPKYGADGNVEEVSLTTVKIRNWDNTLVMLPPYLLTTDSFTNWHAMQLSGGRRVMRSVAIDMTSVRFCTPEMLDHYRTIDLIRDYVDQTERRVEEYNAAHGIGSGERRINGLHQTNLGVFRAYLVRYLRNEVPVNKDMTLMVRQLQPTETGLPMQLYFFTDTVVWVDYEGIQSDVFDHVLAVIPEFGLRVFQNPSGEDVASLRNAFFPNAQTPSQTPPQASPQASSQAAPQNAPPLHASRPAAPQRPQAEQPAPEEAKAPASASPE